MSLNHNNVMTHLLPNIALKFNCKIVGLHMIDLNCCDGKCSNSKIKKCKLREVMLSANSFIVNGVY